MDELSRLIESKIRDTIDAGVLPKQQSAAEKLEAAKAAAEIRRLEFHDRVKNQAFADINPENGALALCIMPALPPKTALDWNEVERKLKGLLQPLGATGWDFRVGGKYLRTFRKQSDSTIDRAATEIDESGMITAARGEVLFERANPGGTVDTKRRWIDARQQAAGLIAGTARYLAALRKLEIKPPWFIGFALLGLSSCRLSVDPRYGNDEAVTFEGSEIVAPLATIESDNETLSTDEGIVALLRPGLHYLAREFNYPRFPGL